MWTKTLSCVAFSLAFVPPALGLDFPDARSTLKGLTAVRVVIGNVTPEIEQDGLTQSGLQADVELRLRQSAIRLVDGTGTPEFLYVRVDSLKTSPVPGYAYSVTVEFFQPVTIRRTGEVVPLAITWSTGLIGFVESNRLAGIRQHVRDRVDEFISAFLSVNPQ